MPRPIRSPKMPCFFACAGYGSALDSLQVPVRRDSREVAMNWMTTAVCFWLFATAAGAVAPTSTVAAASNSIPESKTKFDALLAAIQSRFENDTFQMAGKYGKALEALETDMQNKGDLQGVVAVRKEKALFDRDKNLPVKDAPDLPAPIAALRQKFRQQQNQIGAKCDKDVIDLFQQYTKHLGSLEIQRTKEGKIEEALAIHAELERVKQNADALTTMIDLAGKPAAPEKGTPRPDAPASSPAPNAGSGLKASSLDKIILPIFSFEESGVIYRQIDTLNRFIDAVYNQGVKIRVDANKLEIESVDHERGFPQYHARYRSYSGDYSRRSRNFVLTDAPARSVLQAICACYGLGYRIDPANEEVVVLDKTDGGVEWSADTTPVELLLKDLQSISAKKPLIGKPVLVSGEVAGNVQGTSEFSIPLDNKVRLSFPKNSATVSKTAEIQGKYLDANKANRDESWEQHFVELTVLGEIAKSSGPYQIVLEKCQILECYTGTRYGSHDAPQERKVIRLGDPR